MSSCVLCGGYSHHVGPGRHLLQWRQLLKISGFSTARSYLLAWALRTLRILACPFERFDGPAFSTQCRQSEPPWGQRTEPLAAAARCGAPAGRARLPDRHASLQPANPPRLPPKFTWTCPGDHPDWTVPRSPPHAHLPAAQPSVSGSEAPPAGRDLQKIASTS